jgi:phenol hydroxylase P1 protein
VQVDIQTTSIKPIRHTFSFIARRLGADKPASRYQEATLDMQPEVNFHYRPLWQPEFALYDKRRTAIQMADWYAFKDPRQYYYGTYAMARARQQDAAEKQFEFVEKRGLLAACDEATRTLITEVLVPLRHAEWGANMNNSSVTAYGWGAAITQATMFATMDRLALAQMLSRIGLALDGNSGAALAVAKQQWLHAPHWQGVRRVLENLFVTRDWFELLVAQNLVLDGLLLPLAFGPIEAALNQRTGNALAMSTGFINEWREEHARWVDATVKTAAQESPANAALLSQWARLWRGEVLCALKPLARHALGEPAGDEALQAVAADFAARAARLGLAP